MDSPHWNACGDYFKHKFPTCPKCQGGHCSPEELKIHLAATHFRQDALKTFGKGLACAVCAKVVNPPKEQYKQQYIVYHMAHHLPAFVPSDAKPFLLVAMDMDGIQVKEEESVEKTKSIPEKTEPTTKAIIHHSKSCISDPLWRKCELSLKKKNPQCKTCQLGFRRPLDIKYHYVVVHCDRKALELYSKDDTCALCGEFTVANATSMNPQMAKKNHMIKHLLDVATEENDDLFIDAEKQCNEKIVFRISDPPWQACLKFLKKEYPQCQVCQRGFTRAGDVTDHLLLFHYVDEALGYFGEGKACAVCKTYKVPIQATTMTKEIRRFKQRHMKKHLELIFSGEAKQLFGLALGLDGQLARGIKKSTTNLNQNNENVKRLRLCSSSKIKLNCSKKPKEKQPLKDVKTEMVAMKPWHDCEHFFRNTYSKCIACQTGHDSLASLKMHLTYDHYSKTAIELFGTASTCPICEETVLVLQNTEQLTQGQKEGVITHMSKHLEEFILGKGRTLLQSAVEADPTNSTEASQSVRYNSTSEPNHGVKHLSTTEPSQGVRSPSTTKLSNSVKYPSTTEPSQGVSSPSTTESSNSVNCHSTTEPSPEVSSSNLRNTKHTYTRKKSALPPICGNFKPDLKIDAEMQEPHWQSCVDHFRSLYGATCKICNRGHQSPILMRRHIAYIHHKEMALRLFGKGASCSICKSLSIPSKIDQWKRSHLVRSHMALHLEMFMQDEEGRVLLINAKEASSKQRTKSTKEEPDKDAASLNQGVSPEDGSDSDTESTEAKSEVSLPPSECFEDESTHDDIINDAKMILNDPQNAASLLSVQDTVGLIDNIYSEEAATESATTGNLSNAALSLPQSQETLATTQDEGALGVKLEQSSGSNETTLTDISSVQEFVDQVLVGEERLEEILTDEFLKSPFEFDALESPKKQDMTQENNAFTQRSETNSKDNTIAADMAIADQTKMEDNKVVPLTMNMPVSAIKEPNIPQTIKCQIITPNPNGAKSVHTDLEAKRHFMTTGLALQPADNNNHRAVQPWKECERFFQKTFPKCQSCQHSKHQLGDMLSHLFRKHFPEVVPEAFGDQGNTCQVCNNQVDFPPKSNRAHIKIRHFITAHRQLMFDAVEDLEAREALNATAKRQRSGVKRKLNTKPRVVHLPKIPCFSGWRLNEPDYYDDGDGEKEKDVVDAMVFVDKDEERGFWFDEDCEYEH